MYTLTRIDNPFTGLIYQRFTFPQFRPHLEVLKAEASTVAIAASDSHKPIGLALAEIQPDGQSAEVLSIFVEPTYRCQGVGTALFTRLEQELVSRGCTSANLVYITGQTTTPALERLLQQHNWTPPEPRMLVCKCNRKMLEAPWLNKNYSFPPSFTFFPWQEITPEERLNLQKQQETSLWIPDQLSPFKHEKNLEPLNSLGLRYEGEVVGWVITHRLSPDTIRYTCSYIRPDLQKVGRILSLYAESIKLQAANLEIPNAIWTVPFKFNSMANFVKKRMGEYMDSIEESRGSFKSFSHGVQS
jgi:GNAT superfamily N-acetyltransferase